MGAIKKAPRQWSPAQYVCPPQTLTLKRLLPWPTTHRKLSTAPWKRIWAHFPKLHLMSCKNVLYLPNPSNLTTAWTTSPTPFSLGLWSLCCAEGTGFGESELLALGSLGLCLPPCPPSRSSCAVPVGPCHITQSRLPLLTPELWVCCATAAVILSLQ